MEYINLDSKHNWSSNGPKHVSLIVFISSIDHAFWIAIDCQHIFKYGTQRQCLMIEFQKLSCLHTSISNKLIQPSWLYPIISNRIIYQKYGWYICIFHDIPI
jgi:hypothetical protein